MVFVTSTADNGRTTTAVFGTKRGANIYINNHKDSISDYTITETKETVIEYIERMENEN